MKKRTIELIIAILIIMIIHGVALFSLSVLFSEPKSDKLNIELTTANTTLKEELDNKSKELTKLEEELENKELEISALNEKNNKSSNELSRLQEKLKLAKQETFINKVKYFIKINEEKLVFEKLSDINTYEKIDFNGKMLIPFKLEGNVLSYHDVEKGGFTTEMSLNEKGQAETKILEAWDTKNLDEILQEIAF